jgi:hypothetical protein
LRPEAFFTRLRPGRGAARVLRPGREEAVRRPVSRLAMFWSFPTLTV